MAGTILTYIPSEDPPDRNMNHDTSNFVSDPKQIIKLQESSLVSFFRLFFIIICDYFFFSLCVDLAYTIRITTSCDL